LPWSLRDAAGCAVASFGTFFSTPWRLLALPIAAGMLAHAARWALISVAGTNARRRTRRLHARHVLVDACRSPAICPSAALAFSAVVSLNAGLFSCFNAATVSSNWFDRAERASGFADEHRRERRHGHF